MPRRRGRSGEFAAGRTCVGILPSPSPRGARAGAVSQGQECGGTQDGEGGQQGGRADGGGFGTVGQPPDSDPGQTPSHCEGDGEAGAQPHGIPTPKEGGDGESEATVKLHAGGARVVQTGEGNGPVNALDHALREALIGVYPEIETFELIDFRVRLLDTSHGTDAVTRVLIQTTDGAEVWSTVGVGPNILEAAYEALVDSLVYGLLSQGIEVR